MTRFDSVATHIEAASVMFQRSASQAKIAARLRAIAESLGATGCLLSRAHCRFLSKRITWTRHSYVMLGNARTLEFARGVEDRLGQIAEAFNEPFRLSEALPIVGPVFRETTSALGLVIPLPGGGYLFFCSPTAKNESDLWGRRHAFMRLGAEAMQALDRISATSCSFDGVDAHIIKLSRLQYPIKRIADCVGLSYNAVARHRESICARLDLATFDDVLMSLA
ncbi:hypothetical protein [Paraburkholderia susongensis]|uniref:HTH luxR-type domain-containing protein n=1 Tax=Paraburkholderia susongensis TaxID=1515439 RepID=A0A1X7M731_9BURK|nr:hypothetical protein [Paraburkholderia susongensis]SMG61574.1 hypothetical protein SAMN06265784_12337 [Paraburkholderia susongensis]